MKLLISHIADLDGISPVILMNLLDIDFEYELFEIGEINEFIKEKIDSNFFDKYDDIYITDLSVSKDIALKILNSKYKDKFKLFDHHKSAEWLNEYEFATVTEEVNGFKECGTTLFYQYLIKTFDNDILKKENVVTYVECVREEDTWQFTELKDDADNINNLLGFYGNDEFIELYTDKLKNNSKLYFDKYELKIINALNRKKQDYLESFKDKVIIKRVDSYNIGVVFAEQYRSSLGHYIAEIYQDKIDFVAIINFNRHISFRGIKDIDISVFAEKFGGGGHPKACAMPLPNNIKEKIIEEIFNEDRKN